MSPRTPSSGGSLTSLDPSPSPSAPGPSKKTADQKVQSKTHGSDGSSELSELSSDEEKMDAEEVRSPSPSSPEDNSDTDRPFKPSSIRKASQKGGRGRKRKSSVKVNRASASQRKSQSPAKSKAKGPASKNTSTGAPRQSSQKSGSQSPLVMATTSSRQMAPSVSTASSTSSAPNIPSASAGDDSEEEGATRRSSRRKRSAVIPPPMWDWAFKKPKSSTRKPPRSTQSESEHGSQARDASSPPADDAAGDDKTALPDTNDDDQEVEDDASRIPDEEEEDIKPDINVLQLETTPLVKTGVADPASSNQNSIPASNRTSPGLPLSASAVRRASMASTAKVEVTLDEQVGDAMDIDPSNPVDDTPTARPHPKSGSGSNNNSSLDILAQFAATLGDGEAPAKPSESASVEGTPAPPDGIPESAAISEADEEEDLDTREPAGDEDPDDDAGEDTVDADIDVGDEEELPEPAPSSRSKAKKKPQTRPGRTMSLLAKPLETNEDEDEGEDERNGDDEDEADNAQENSDHESTKDVAAKLEPVEPDEGSPQDGEPEIEAEQEIENEIQPTQRVEALDILAGMELKFALLRERIFLDKMRDIAREEKLLLDGSHPEYMVLLAELQRRKDRKLQLASIRLEQEKQFITHKRKMEEHAVWDRWNEAKIDVRTEMLAEHNAKRRKLEREKRSIDAHKLPRPVPQMPAPTQKHRDTSIKEDVKAQLAQYSSLTAKNGRSGAWPSLAPLSQNELATDMEIILGRNRAHSTTNHHNTPPQPNGHAPHHPAPHAQAPYPGPYGPAPGYGQPPPPGYGQPLPAGTRYPQPPGYGHPMDPNGPPINGHHLPPQPMPGYGEPQFDPYGPPYPPLMDPYGPPPGQYLPPPGHHGYGPPPPPPQQHSVHPSHPHQPLHQPQPQHYAYPVPHREPSPGAYRKNTWNGPNGPPEINGSAPREKVVIDLTRMSPDDGDRLPPPHPKTEPLDRAPKEERPSSSASRMPERLPPLSQLTPPNDPRVSAVLPAFGTSSTPRPSSSHTVANRP